MTLFRQEEWFLLTMRLIEYGREYSPARKKEDNTDPISLKQVLTLTQTQT